GGTVTAIYYWAATPSGRRIVASIGATIPSRPGASTALVAWENGRVETLALEGDLQPGGTVYGGSNYLLTNAAGHVAVSTQNHIYVYDEAGVHEAVSLASLPAGRNWSGIFLEDFNDNGDLLFSALDHETGGTIGSTLLMDVGGTISELFHTGVHSVE